MSNPIALHRAFHRNNPRPTRKLLYNHPNAKSKPLIHTPRKDAAV